jgi:hypothetical protein
MGWQERQAEIGPALKTLKDLQRRAGKRGTRTHEDTCLDRVALIIALESGPCRDCQGLKITVYEEGVPFPSVGLRCNFGQSPLSLHLPYTTSLGEAPECPSQVPFEQEEESLIA